MAVFFSFLIAGGILKGTRCSVFGLGKLGSPLAGILAKHFPTIGVDLNPAIVASINAGKAPVQEPGLQELLTGTSLTATLDVEEAILNSNVSFIIVPTPSGSDGKFTNRYILDVLAKIGPVLAKKTSYHLINITSTVMPGSMRNEIKTALELASGKELGEQLGLTYNPEFIALGDVIKGIEQPDMVLIGESESDSADGEVLENIYQSVCPGCKSLVRTSYENAELAKLSLNTFLTMKIAYANTLGEICEAIPNADAAEVTKIIAKDSRISPKFLTPGMPYGGPCLPRDTVAFSAMASSLGIKSAIADATKQVNEQHIEWLVNKISAQFPAPAQIAVLGLSYKAGTDVTEASAGLALCLKLSERDYAVQAFDPLIKSPSKEFASSKCLLATDLASCVKDSAVIIICTPCKEFLHIKDVLQEQANVVTIIDCARLFPEQTIEKGDLQFLGKSAAKRKLKLA